MVLAIQTQILTHYAVTLTQLSTGLYWFDQNYWKLRHLSDSSSHWRRRWYSIHHLLLQQLLNLTMPDILTYCPRAQPIMLEVNHHFIHQEQ